MQSSGPNIQDSSLQIISKTSQSTKFNKDYFIFADKFHDINQVITSLPGGFDIINSIRGKQVDRYIYGSEPLQNISSDITHSHNSGFIKLAGQPFAQLKNNCPYSGMQDLNDCRVSHIKNISDGLFSLYLQTSNQSLSFLGYESLDQLGKYYTLTVDNKVTRLYSVVNFLNTDNLVLMSKITKNNFNVQASQPMQSAQAFKRENMLNSEISEYNGKLQVPLLIKRYVKGRLTKDFLINNYSKEIQLSRPLGRGLSLHERSPGQIIIFAGGTGLNPFCDLIDLLFKQYLITSKSVFSEEILLKNSILNKISISNKHRFKFYISVSSADEIHSVTLLQLNTLAEEKIIEAHVRTSQGISTLSKYSSIKKLNNVFDPIIKRCSQKLEQISQIYVCGPVRLSKILLNELKNSNIPQEKYKIL